MTNTISNVADFTIKVIMIFTTIVALAFFANQYPLYAFTFGLLNLVFVLAIVTKGLFDIFSKE